MAIGSVARHRAQPGTGAWLTRLSGVALLGPLVSAILLWAVSLRQVDLTSMTDLGLVSVLPVSFYFALLVLTISFGVLVHRGDVPAPLLALHIVVLVVIIHGTPEILYGTVRYAWAWKHVGIVDYIQRHGSVNPESRVLDAYHNWPGFFILGALLTDVAGLGSALSFAGWGPVFFNLVFLGPLLLIARTWANDRRLVWLSIWFFYLASWVGQDYFSPQALTYFLHLVIVGICLRWFTPHVMSPLQATGGRLSAGTAATFVATPVQRAGLIALAILLFGFVAASHQLTPFTTTLAIAGLVMLRRSEARTLPLLYVVITITWITFVAEPFLRNNPWIVRSIGQLGTNFASALIDFSLASQGMKFIAQVDRVLTGLVGVLAILGLIRRLRRGHRDLACVVLMLAPLPMIAGNAYGGEMAFRVYFFALPFATFLAAAFVYPSPEAGRSRRTAGAVLLLSSVLLAGFCLAYYGKERMFYFTRDEVAAVEYLYDVSPPGALWVGLSSYWPKNYRDYERYGDYDVLPSLPKEERSFFTEDPVDFFARLDDRARPPALYVVITRSQLAQIEMLGLLPPGSVEAIEQALLASDRFKLSFSNADALVFTSTGGG